MVFDGAGGEGSPSPGDFSLCINCGSLNVFDENLRLRQPNLDEYVESTKNPDVQKGRKIILRLLEERKRENG